ncbi:MAG: hypothetical protein LLG01_01655 [Planctomycetaceae bacterium]|nr:hypothetical protein [Planctomycetaceae bacterium]
MKRPPVVLDLSQRLIVCRTFAEALLFHKVELIDLAVSGEHYHLLARFTPVGNKVTVQALKSTARRLVGIAKKSSARILNIGGVWGVRGCEKPVADRTHQLSVVEYIRDHAQEGAVVWSTVREAQGL